MALPLNPSAAQTIAYHGEAWPGARGYSTVRLPAEAGPPAATAEETTAPSRRRFVVAFLGSFFAVLAGVLTFNVVVDPFALAGSGVVPTAVEPDRSIKLDLLQKLKRGPQILILGDSRGRQAEPAFLRRLTGRNAFNAAVTGGSAPDAYVFVRLAADRFPHQKRHYIWFTDVGLASSVVLPQLAQDPRARRYLRGGPRFGLGDVKTYVSTDATRASWRVFEKCVLGSCRSHLRYHADGSLTDQSLRYLPEHAKSLRKSVAKAVAAARAHLETLAQWRRDLSDPHRFVYLERMLAFMNRRGEVPVIVLNPIYPSVLATLDRQGFPGRRATLEKIAQLHKRFRFVLVNCEDSRRWGGTTYDWSNATHVNRANMRRELRYIVAHSRGTLR
jgi:hypothetical protein